MNAEYSLNIPEAEAKTPLQRYADLALIYLSEALWLELCQLNREANFWAHRQAAAYAKSAYDQLLPNAFPPYSNLLQFISNARIQ